MKKILPFKYFVLFAAVCLSAISCGPSKKIVRDAIKIPCFGDKYQTESGYVLASGMGESSDMMLSMKKARSNTLEALGSKISTSVQSVINNYYSSTGSNASEEIVMKYEGITKEVIDAKISGYETECESTIQNDKGAYQTYYCFKISEEKVLLPLLKKLSETAGLNMNMDYDSFVTELRKSMK
ncbi:MAG: hypothetical protein ACERKD_23730 [Prolixibacteraceae bacterium]